MAPHSLHESSASILSRYDALLVLKITSHSSLDPVHQYPHVIRDIALKSNKRLLIYFPTTSLWLQLAQNRSKSFEKVQTLLSQLYILATAELPEFVPCDIVLQVLRGDDKQDLLIDLDTLQQPEKLKQLVENVHIFNDDANAPDNTDGHAAAQDITAAAADNESSQVSITREDSHLGTVALGGTFDHLHAGHKILLSMACWLGSKRVIVGISDDVLLKNKSDRDLLESLEHRTNTVKNFLELICPHIQHDLPALQDVYGPTSTDPDVQGIIFSEESRKGAVSVAQIRKERNLSTLETFVISVISPEQVIDTDIVSKDEMLKVKMGSTQIRRRIRERMQQGEA